MIKGVPQDFIGLKNPPTRPQDQGFAQAQSNLGVMYYQGQGL